MSVQTASNGWFCKYKNWSLAVILKMNLRHFNHAVPNVANQVMLLKKNDPTCIFSWWRKKYCNICYFLSLSPKSIYSSTYFVLQISYGVFLRPVEGTFKGNICGLNLTLLFLHIQSALLLLKGHYCITSACLRPTTGPLILPRMVWLCSLVTTRPQGWLRIYESINQMLRSWVRWRCQGAILILYMT